MNTPQGPHVKDLICHDFMNLPKVYSSQFIVFEAFDSTRHSNFTGNY